MGKRKVRKQNQEVFLRPPSNPRVLEIIHRLSGLAGIALILWGLQMIAQTYFLAVVFVYVGFAAILVEIVQDPYILGFRYQAHIALLGLWVFLVAWFTLVVVIVHAPLNVHSYAMRNANHPANTVVAGISWNDHFTDLRVVVTNPSHDDYDDFDLEIKPDTPTYKAAILGESAGCKLLSIGGSSWGVKFPAVPDPVGDITVNRIGKDQLDVESRVNGSFSTLLTNGGYRLKCDKFPSEFPIVVVFALAVPRFSNPEPGPGLTLMDINIPNATSEFDVLGDRPSPQKVTFSGKFKYVRQFAISQSSDVQDGN